MKKRRWAVGKTKDKREKDIQGALATHNRMHDDEQTKHDITKTMDPTYLKSGPLLAVLVDVIEEGLDLLLAPCSALEGVHLPEAVAVDALDGAVGQGARDLHPRPLALLLVVHLLAAQMAGGDVASLAVLGDGPSDRLGLLLAELARRQRLRRHPFEVLGPAVALDAAVGTSGGGRHGIGTRLAVLVVVRGRILGKIVAQGRGGGRGGGDRLARVVSSGDKSFVGHCSCNIKAVSSGIFQSDCRSSNQPGLPFYQRNCARLFRTGSSSIFCALVPGSAIGFD